MLHDASRLANPQHVIKTGQVLSNVRLCDEHYRLTFVVDAFPNAFPGQFLHLGPERNDHKESWSHGASPGLLPQPCEPFLRRAFSIAGLRRTDDAVELDVIYRVVGASTGWMSRLRPGDCASILGPQGNRFPIHDRGHAWLIAGGVGLPPLLWFSEELAGLQTSARGVGRDVVFFYGSQRASVTALQMDLRVPLAKDACAAALSSVELAALGIPLVLSTDDGSLGFRGHVGQALEAYWAANPVAGDQLVLYTCGPERMMAYVAKFATRVGALCYACVERSMACATGMCQSCVVPVHDPGDADGWRYRLCCTDGPIFESGDIIWDFEASGTSKAACS